MADQAVEQEPPGFRGRGVGVAVGASGVDGVDHPEFGDGVGELLLAHRTGSQVESPAMQPRLHAVERQEPESALPLGSRAVVGRFGIPLVEAVEHDLVAVFERIREVQDVRGVGLEPADLGGVTAPGQHREPGGDVAVEAGEMHVVLEERGIPEQREVIEDDVVVGEGHVVGQPRPGQRHIGAVYDVTVGADHPVSQVRRLLAVAEVQQFSGTLVDFGVCGNPPVRGKPAVPVLLAERGAGARVGAIQVAALIVARQRHPAVHHDVRGRRILHQRPCTPAVVDTGQFDGFGDARPQRPARPVLLVEAVGAHEPVAVERLPVPKADDVQHAVAVERVVVLQRRVQRVLGVAQIHAVEVGRQLSGDHGEVVGIPLARLRTPRTGAVRMVVVLGQRGQELADYLGVGHDALPTTKLTVVDVLPPKFRVANVAAPSTW